MLLNEIAFDVEMKIAIIQKLLDKGVLVKFKTVSSDNGTMHGKIVKLRYGATATDRQNTICTMVFSEQLRNGEYDTALDHTGISEKEMKMSTLTKQEDGSYMFDLPNEEFM